MLAYRQASSIKYRLPNKLFQKSLKLITIVRSHPLKSKSVSYYQYKPQSSAILPIEIDVNFRVNEPFFAIITTKP